MSGRRVALIAEASSYVGPALARTLAARGHDLIVGDPAPALVEELEAAGATVEVVTGAHDLSDPASAPAPLAAGLERFGRIDAAAVASGRIVTGRFTRSTVDDLKTVVGGCMEAPYHFLRSVVPPMVEAGGGQVLVIASAVAARPACR